MIAKEKIERSVRYAHTRLLPVCQAQIENDEII
jgi:hypothetical protein